MNTCKTCGKPTNFLKPYCAAHVEKCEYASRILLEQHARTREEDAIRKQGKVDLDGFLVKDILTFLQCGNPRRLDRISRLLNVEFRVLLKIADALHAKGICARVNKTRRGEGHLVLRQESFI